MLTGKDKNGLKVTLHLWVESQPLLPAQWVISLLQNNIQYRKHPELNNFTTNHIQCGNFQNAPLKLGTNKSSSYIYCSRFLNRLQDSRWHKVVRDQSQFFPWTVSDRHYRVNIDIQAVVGNNSYNIASEWYFFVRSLGAISYIVQSFK
jgi:hypothetical protein